MGVLMNKVFTMIAGILFQDTIWFDV